MGRLRLSRRNQRRNAAKSRRSALAPATNSRDNGLLHGTTIADFLLRTSVLHAWHDVSPGKELPRDFQAVIEIPLGSNVKYELDKATGLLRVDRIIHSAVFYPANYGFIPQTYAEDNDPLDVLVLCQEPVQPLALIKARAIGVMTMVDSGATDDKIIAVATNDPEFSDYLEARDLPPHRLLVLRRFFQDYKQLEGKQVQVDEIRPAYAALTVIERALARYQEKREELLAKDGR